MSFTPQQADAIKRFKAASNTSDESMATEIRAMMNRERAVIAATIKERVEELINAREENNRHHMDTSIAVTELQRLADYVESRGAMGR